MNILFQARLRVNNQWRYGPMRKKCVQAENDLYGAQRAFLSEGLDVSYLKVQMIDDKINGDKNHVGE